MNLEVRHLKVLVAVARNGSIRGAAASLQIAQPNLSQQVKRIEEQFQAPLFHRNPAGICPTEYGAAILKRAEDILDRINALADVQPASVLRHLFFDIDISTVLGDVGALPARSVWESAPARPADGIGAVLKGAADIFVGVQWPHTPWPDFLGLASVNLFSHDMTVLIREDHPVGGMAGPVNLDSLSDEQWIARSAVRTTTELECGRFGFSPAVRTTDDEGARRRMLAAGAVTFFNPRNTVPTGFRALRYDDPSHIHHLMHYHQDHVTWHEAEAISAAVREKCTSTAELLVA